MFDVADQIDGLQCSARKIADEKGRHGGQANDGGLAVAGTQQAAGRLSELTNAIAMLADDDSKLDEDGGVDDENEKDEDDFEESARRTDMSDLTSQRKRKDLRSQYVSQSVDPFDSDVFGTVAPIADVSRVEIPFHV